MSARKSTFIIGAILAAGMALAGIGLPKCNGAGLGSAAPGSRESPEPTEPPANKDTRAIEVRGGACIVDNAEPIPCPEACAALLEAPPSRVEVDGTAGTHKVVQDLRACLQESSIDVRMLSS